jgi:hypothetical protein
MNPAQALARWIGGVTTGETALAERIRKLEAHCANPPRSADPAEHRAWLATKRDLEDDVAAEEAALQIAREEAAKAKAAADEADRDAEERRIKKLNGELAKLTTEIGADAERLGAKLQRHTSMVAEVEKWNANRGSRAFIKDGEAKVREIPEKHFPTVYEETTVWKDAAGRTPSIFLRGEDGELVPKDGGYRPVKEKFVSRNAYTVPAQIPGGRYREGFKLLGLKGELFPTR